ncbi:hypothetical protein GGI20_000708 [Coemansia sp. BCRC 34301]|nr:hypothetical protein GGI20_000708 [Coemansia sp. BCRC 34301]
MKRTAAAPTKRDKSALGVYVDPSAPPSTRPGPKHVSVGTKQPLQPECTRNAVGNILQEASNINKKFTLSPNSLIAAEKENFDPVRKQLVTYRRTTSKAKPLEEKGGEAARPPLGTRYVSEQVDDSIGSSNTNAVPSTPTSRVLANRRARQAAVNAAAGTKSTATTQTLCAGKDEICLPPTAGRLGGRPGRSMSVAIISNQPKRPVQSRKTSCSAAGGAGVDDLVHLLGSMDVVYPNSTAASRLGQLQALRRPGPGQSTAITGFWLQDTNRASRASELRLNAPPPVATWHASKLERKPQPVTAASTYPPQGFWSGRTPLPANKPSNKQSKLLSSAMLTPPELRKSIR